MRTIDLNCDLGEGFPHDAELTALVSSVNVACGGHAGDETTMRSAVRLAAAAGVNVGAHPGYEDREHFGRAEVSLSPREVRELIRRQIDRLHAIARAEGVALRHVKPHGALYHAAARDAAIAGAIIDGIDDESLAVVGPPAGEFITAAARAGRRYLREGFIDRRYRPDGTLVSRGRAGAVLVDAAEAARQATTLAINSRVVDDEGGTLELKVDTLCVHGDGPAACEVLRLARNALQQAGVRIAPA